MDMQNAIRAISKGSNLSADDMQSVVGVIMSGEATQAQIGALLVALRVKGETVDEITGAARMMRELAANVDVDGDQVVDTVGTGGDRARLFNISTTCAFVAAAAGAQVAKHGNRAATSNTGSADVLEASGVKIDLTPEQVGQCINKVGIGFMFAPTHHGATRHAVGPRKEIGVPSIFNLLGPLTNPAGARRQLVGVFEKRWLRPLAEVLKELGSKHAIVVHSAEGLDEISLAGESFATELKDGEIHEFSISPTDFGIEIQPITPLVVESPEQSLALVKSVLSGDSGPASDIVALNAGATIHAGDLVPNLEEGVLLAQQVIASGKGLDKLSELAEFSQSFS